MASASRDILVLYWVNNRELLPWAQAHLRALEHSPARHRLCYVNGRHGVPRWLARAGFDAVLLHPTLLSVRWTQWFPMLRAELSWLADWAGAKIALPQDEYDGCHILDDWFEELGISSVGSNFNESLWPLLYPRTHRRAHFFQCLTSYIDEAAVRRCARGFVPAARRPLDIVYRSFRLGHWFGAHARLKNELPARVAELAPGKGLRCDVATQPDRALRGQRWFDFLASGRATVGCQSGASAFNPRGEVRRRVQELARQDPTISFDEVNRQFAPGWDGHPFLTLGPRHFEAVLTRTCQILVEGDYGGVLRAERHYLPLRPDLANLDEVLDRLADHDGIDAMTQRAHEDICGDARYRYAALARSIDQALESAPRRLRRTARPTWARTSLRRCRLTGRATRSGVSRLRSWGTLVRVLAKAYWTEPAFRRVCHTFARHWRRLLRLPLGQLVELVRLAILLRGAGHDSASGRLTCRVFPAAGIVSLLSLPAEQAAPQDELDLEFLTDVREIRWDYSAIPEDARHVFGAALYLDSEGIQRFPQLVAAARQDPEGVLALLRRLCRPHREFGLVNECISLCDAAHP